MVSIERERSICVKSAFSILSIIFLLTLSSDIYAQSANPQETLPRDANSVPIRRKPIENVRLVSFILNGGQRVSGRVESEDAFEIRLSEIKDAEIVSFRYYKNDIDKKSIIYKNVSGLDYWRDTGEYFLRKVWDFQNDPDEFIQAIRCFEKAKILVQDAVGAGHKLAAELDEKISRINADMQKWSEQARTRVEMRNLETLATLDSKLQQFQEQIAENSKAVSDLRTEIKNVSAASGNYEQLRDKVNNSDIWMRVFEQRIIKLESDMDNFWRWNRNQPRYYYVPPKSKPDANS